MELNKRKTVPTTASVINALINSGGSISSEEIVILGANQLVDYYIDEEQPFKPYTEEKLAEMAVSIKQDGILEPCIVWDNPDKENYNEYMILAGHNRKNASVLAGNNEIPCIIKKCDRNTAKRIMVVTNLKNRENLSYSEKAKAYKIEVDCGSTLTSIAAENETNRKQIGRYLKLNELIPELMEDVDNGTLQFISGVDLAYLPSDKQYAIHKYTDEHKIKLNPKYCEALKETFASDTEISDEALTKFFEKPPKIENKITFSLKDLKEYFGDMPAEEVRNHIIQIIDVYFRRELEEETNMIEDFEIEM